MGYHCSQSPAIEVLEWSDQTTQARTAVVAKENGNDSRDETEDGELSVADPEIGLRGGRSRRGCWCAAAFQNELKVHTGKTGSDASQADGDETCERVHDALDFEGDGELESVVDRVRLTNASVSSSSPGMIDRRELVCLGAAAGVACDDVLVLCNCTMPTPTANRRSAIHLLKLNLFLSMTTEKKAVVKIFIW